MSLHDRLRASGNGTFPVPEEASDDHSGSPVRVLHGERTFDPYAELKTRVHQCIAKLGPELFSAQTTQDLSDRVLRTVTEQLALDRTPSRATSASSSSAGSPTTSSATARSSRCSATIRERGHGQRGPDQIYVERSPARLELTKSAFVDDAHLLRIVDKIVSSIGRRIDESSPMVDARLPDGSRVNAIIPPPRCEGRSSRSGSSRATPTRWTT